MKSAFQQHWPEYLMEGAGLGLFMVSAGLFGTLLEYSGSPVRQALEDPFLRRILMGLAMALTAVVLIYYPWGQQSGAHYNPAVTLAFLRLRKIEPADAVFYIAAQCVGGVMGVVLVWTLLGHRFSDPPVQYVATVPDAGVIVALIAEIVISAGLMLTVLFAIGSPRYTRFTGWLAGLLLAVYITFEAPLSGMSINPARTLASSLPGNIWTGWWVYLLAPTAGMWLAVDLHRLLTHQRPGCCPKLNHGATRRCIFCGFRMSAQAPPAEPF